MQTRIVEERRSTVGMGEVGDRLRHALECSIEPCADRSGAEHVAAFEEISEDLCMVRQGALVMETVGQDLVVENPLKQAHSVTSPPPRRTSHKEAGGPDQCLSVLDEMVAADVRLKVASEKSELSGNAVRHAGAQIRIK